jgi:hypothetical protein
LTKYQITQGLVPYTSTAVPGTCTTVYYPVDLQLYTTKFKCISTYTYNVRKYGRTGTRVAKFSTRAPCTHVLSTKFGTGTKYQICIQNSEYIYLIRTPLHKKVDRGK